MIDVFARVCRKLKRLNLGGNELTSVPQRALSIFDALRKLEIQENKIRIIKEGDFEGIILLSYDDILNASSNNNVIRTSLSFQD